MLKPLRDAILSEINDFDLRFEEGFENPLDVLTPSAEGEIPYLELDSEVRSSTLLRVAYKKNADGGRGTPAGFYMQGGDTDGNGNEKWRSRIRNFYTSRYLYSSTLNSKWGKKFFKREMTTADVATESCDGCYSCYNVLTSPPFKLTPEAMKEKEKLSSAKGSSDYLMSFGLCHRCFNAATDEAADTDEDKAFTTPAGRTLERDRSVFVSARDIREGKVVQLNITTDIEEQKKTRAVGRYVYYHVFG